MTETPPPPRGARVLAWGRRMVDLIPTPWLITAATGVLLATTAAFGGLNAVPVPPTPEVAVGEAFTGSDLQMTVRSVELSDTRPDSGVFPDEAAGERVLAVTVDVVNVHTTPRPSSTLSNPSASVDGILVDGVTGKPEVSRVDDAEYGPILQPDVPAQLLLAWVVAPGTFRDGDAVRISLPDATRVRGESVVIGEYWTDITVGAYVDATVDEVAVDAE